MACGDDVVVAVEASEFGDEVGAYLACGAGYEDFFQRSFSYLYLCVTPRMARCSNVPKGYPIPSNQPWIPDFSGMTVMRRSCLGGFAIHRGTLA